MGSLAYTGFLGYPNEKVLIGAFVLCSSISSSMLKKTAPNLRTVVHLHWILNPYHY